MNLEEFVKQISKPSVTIITGRRGSGKDVTAVALALAIQKQTGKNVYSNYDPGQFSLPRNWRLRTGNQFDPETIQLISDAHLEYFSRDWQSSGAEALVKIVSVSRHRNIDFIYTTQLTTLLDRQAIANLDVMIFKEPSLLAGEFERKELDAFTQRATEYFSQGAYEEFDQERMKGIHYVEHSRSQKWKWEHALAFTHDKGEIELENIKKPVWFTEEMSKIFGQSETKSGWKRWL